MRPHTLVALTVSLGACSDLSSPDHAIVPAATEDVVVTYTAVALPRLAGGRWTVALAINDAGTIVGWSEIKVGGVIRSHAARWKGTSVFDLGTLPGDLSSVAYDINNTGVIVGQSGSTPVLWSSAGQISKFVDPTGFVPSAINNQGVLTGRLPNGHLARWKNGIVTDIQPAGSAGGSFADVNDAGDIVGSVGFPDGSYHAFLWNANGTTRDLGTLGGEVGNLHFSQAFAINNSRMITGTTTVDETPTSGPSPWDAFSWTSGGGMIPVGAVPVAGGLAVSSLGRIFGYENDPAPRPITWRVGKITTLPTLFPGDMILGSGGVNRCGVMFGNQYTLNGHRAEKWIPSVCDPTAPNKLPTAKANGPYSGTVGQPIQFSSLGSFDPEGAWNGTWTFGDGTSYTGIFGNGASQNPTHAYSAAGSYPVTFTVTDANGAKSTASTSASIQ